MGRMDFGALDMREWGSERLRFVEGEVRMK